MSNSSVNQLRNYSDPVDVPPIPISPEQLNEIEINYISYLNYLNYCNYLKLLYDNIILYLNKKGPIFYKDHTNLQTYQSTYLLIVNKNTLLHIIVLLKLLNINKLIYLSKEGEPISAMEHKTTYTTIKKSETGKGYVYCLENDINIDGCLISF
tara:strand:+ start:414 stop:872 length:459 start_codon:yes stop_codon:yes gene_type:complete